MRWRLELCHKDRTQLKDLFVVLRSRPKLIRQLQGFNVPNKCKGTKFLSDTISWINASTADLPKDDLDVVVHYSMKYQAGERMKMDKCVENFKVFCSACEKSSVGSCRRHDVLVVTGSKPKKNDSLNLFQNLGKSKWRKMHECAHRVDLHTAFNPFLEEPEKSVEFERLRKKLDTGLCKGVWLQIGTDLEQLTEGLDYIQSLTRKNDASVDVYGGLFFPSKQLLAQQKFRPWAGVKLSKDYLNSLDTALDITRDILRIFFEYGVTPLIESRVYKVQQLEDIHKMLSEVEHTM